MLVSYISNAGRHAALIMRKEMPRDSQRLDRVRHRLVQSVKMPLTTSHDSGKMSIRCSGAQSQILHRRADGEMIKALPVVADQAQRVMQHIVEVAADARAANPGGFGRQIQRLANHAGFPE